MTSQVDSEIHGELLEGVACYEVQDSFFNMEWSPQDGEKKRLGEKLTTFGE